MSTLNEAMRRCITDARSDVFIGDGDRCWLTGSFASLPRCRQRTAAKPPTPLMTYWLQGAASSPITTTTTTTTITTTHVVVVRFFFNRFIASILPQA